jgi:ABC-2 type transport system ATP-binding protein
VTETAVARAVDAGQESERGGATVVAHDLKKSFGTVRALAGVSITLRPGELYGLVGPDGAGKTTTIRILAGLVLPDAGEVTLFDESPTKAGVRERLGLMPQRSSLYRDLSVAENLRFFGQLNALPSRLFRERRERLLEITRLGPFLQRRADALSGGMYKKLALACALLHRPEVLLLDEPTNGVDPVSRRELWELLYEFVEDGMTVLLSTPYLDEAERCHRVGLLHDGKLLLQGEPAELLRDFAEEAYEVHGGNRLQVEKRLRDLPEICASSPAGSRLRVVVLSGGAPKVAAELAKLDATLEAVTPSFEDLYLATLHREDS